MQENMQQENKLNRRNSRITCIVFLLAIFGLFAFSITKKDTSFSENENRYLAKKPEFSIQSLYAGEYTKDYETYITDQFVLRDQWIAMKVYAEKALLKKDINGVFFGKDGYLIERQTEDEMKQSTLEKNKKMVEAFVKQYKDKLNIKVMLVPTASEVLSDKLPKYATFYDQDPFMDSIYQNIGANHAVDVRETLRNHKQEPIYYRTDHHWTTLGAYYAYEQWAKQTGITPYKQDDFMIEEATKDFYGTLYSKVNIPMPADSIFLYHSKEDKEYRVMINEKKELGGLYDLSKLKEKDKYSVLLGGNNSYVTIDTNVKNGRKLLVIKDSYAHSIVPFVANHFESTIMLDYRYYNGSTKALIENEGITDVLILYNSINFVKDNYIGKLLK